MSIYMKLVNFNREFSQLSHPPTIVNDVSTVSIDEKEALKKQIYTTYDSDVMDVVPSCDCKQLTGERKVGRFCKNCKSIVVSPTEANLQSILWVRAPKGVNKLINPYIWGLLTQTFKRSGFNVIQWMCDSAYTCKSRTPPELKNVTQNWKRSYNNFVENFHDTIKMLFSLKTYKKHPKKYDILRLLRENKDAIFCDFIPLPNKAIHVIEGTNVGRYAEQSIFDAVNAILMVVGIDLPGSKTQQRVCENRTAKMLTDLSSFYLQYYKNFLGSKPGLIRKHILGTRSHWSFRAVITSITEPHRYDELYVPWGVAIGSLRLHLINKLARRGFNHAEATTFITAHAQKYHPLLDQIFKELIDEAPGRGIPCTLCRNPSLSRGSIQRLRITRIKTDPEIPTLSISILIVRAYNADFDGDALGGALTLDQELTVCMDAHLPHMSAFEINKPRTVSDNLAMPKTVVATVSAGIHSPDADEDQSLMEEFACA